MPLPPQTKAKYLTRFDELIRIGEGMLVEALRGRHEPIDIGGHKREDPTVHWADPSQFAHWQTASATLLGQAVPLRSVHAPAAEKFRSMANTNENVRWGTAALKAMREDFDTGFLGDLGAQIEAELAADYMGQAEQLLKEGQTGKYDHVPAAVLAGAVLEKGLRTLCAKQAPPVSTAGADGKPLMLNALIDALKKAGAFNELTAKQLRAWADIRNKAAHGEFGQFKRDDVELMLKGVNSFLTEHR